MSALFLFQFRLIRLSRAAQIYQKVSGRILNLVLLLIITVSTSPLSARALPSPEPLQALSSTANLVYVCDQMNIARTDNIVADSPNWVKITPPGDRAIVDCVIDPWHPGTKMWIVGTDGIWKGENLDNDNPVWTLVQPMEAIIAATDGHTGNHAIPDRIVVSPSVEGAIFVLYSHGGLSTSAKTWVGRSIDDGVTWSWTLMAAPGEGTQARDVGFAVSPGANSPDEIIVWGSPTGGLLYKSEDGGQTFQMVSTLPDLESFYQIHSIYSPLGDNDGSVLYIGGGSDSHAHGYIWRTLDGGETWEWITPDTEDVDLERRGPFNKYELNGPMWSSSHTYALIQKPVDHGHEHKQLYFSSDPSDPYTWTLRFDFRTWSFDVVGVGVNPIDENRLIVMREVSRIQPNELIYLSQDGGLSWQDKSGDWQTAVGNWQGGIAAWETVDYATAATAGVLAFVESSKANLWDLSNAAFDVGFVGDYFLDDMDKEQAKGVVNIIFNTLALFGGVVEWNKATSEVSRIATGNFDPSLDATWKGFVGNNAARFFPKALWDMFHMNQKVAANTVISAGWNYFAKEFGKTAIRQATKDFFVKTMSPGSDSPVTETMGFPIKEVGLDLRSSLHYEAEAMPPQLNLSPEQAAQYLADLHARQVVHQQITDRLLYQRDRLVYFKEVDQSANYDLQKFIAWLVLRYSLTALLTLAFDGPGYAAAGLTTSGLKLLYDAASAARELNHSQNLFAQSITFLNTLGIAYGQIGFNTMNALHSMKAGRPPQIAEGQIRYFEMHSFGEYRFDLGELGWKWAERNSGLVITIDNPSAYSVTYFPSAAYTITDFWKGSTRLIVDGAGANAAAEELGIVFVDFKQSNGVGVSPAEGSWFDLLIMGGTDTGLYSVERRSHVWQPVRYEVATEEQAAIPSGLTPADAEEAPTIPFPITSMINAQTSTADHLLTIDLINPFSVQVDAELRQPFPDGFEVIDAGDGTIVDGALSWAGTIEPETSLRKSFVLRWSAAPGSTTSFPGAVLTFTAPATGQSDTYQALDQEVEAAWPVWLSGEPPETYLNGVTTDLNLSLTNRSAAAVAGELTLTVSTVAGQSLWSEPRSFSIPPRETAEIPFSIRFETDEPVAIWDATVSFGETSRASLLGLAEVRSPKLFLPVVQRQ